MFDLTGKIALVTGASRGLGKGIALAMAEQGADVAVNYVSSAAKAEEVASQIRSMGRRAVTVKCDVAKQDEVLAMFDKVEAELGPVDILVNNAGIDSFEGFDEMTLEQWNRVFDCDSAGAFLCAQRAVPNMRAKKWGRIISIASITGEQGALFGEWHYAAAKGAQIAFTKTLARTEAVNGITVNCIAPGMIGTELLTESLGDVEPGTDMYNALMRCPMGRLGVPKDIGAAAVYLASDEANYVTGYVLDVNGGMLMR